MAQTKAHISYLQSLTAQWRFLGMMAVVVVRQILRLETSDPRRALEQARGVDVWICTAVAALTQQLTVLEQVETPVADTDGHAHLRAMLVALIALAVLLQSVVQRLAASGRGGETFASASFAHMASAAMDSGSHPRPAFIDTG